VKIQEIASPIFPLDPMPQDFLYNRFVPKLLGNPCIYLLKNTLKYIHQITNRLIWFNQQRISSWHNAQRNINWEQTLQYIMFGERLLALHTDPSASTIKNFKIKLLSEELP
ncbi:7406_t:CDS:1, partial [Ambispora leptoticha]